MKKSTLLLLILSFSNNITSQLKLATSNQFHVYYDATLLSSYGEEMLKKNDTISVVEFGKNKKGKEYWKIKLSNNRFKYLPVKNLDGNDLIKFTNTLDEIQLKTNFTKRKRKKDSLLEVMLLKEKRKKDSLDLIQYKLLRKEYEDELKNDCRYNLNTIDEFDDIRKKYTEIYNLISFSSSEYRVEGDLEIQLIKRNDEKYIRFFSNRDLGCTVDFGKNRSWVKIKLENNKIISFYKFDSTDCESFKIMANITQSDILNLKKSPIKMVRLNGVDYYHDIKKIKWKTFFIDKLDCIK